MTAPLRQTLDAIRLHHNTAGRLRLYARNVDTAVHNFGPDYMGFKLVIDPSIPSDRIFVRNNQGETLSTIVLPGKA